MQNAKPVRVSRALPGWHGPGWHGRCCYLVVDQHPWINDSTRHAAYVPAQDAPWERASPALAGFDGVALARAVAFAVAHDSPWPADIGAVIAGGAFDPPPWNRVLGPTRQRGGPSGLVLSGGRIVAEWGDIQRADMSFSVAKSYLAILVGVALDRGLIADIRQPVRLSCPDPELETTQNQNITWLDLLQQTSEMAVELWGIPDTVDRNRQLSPHEDRARLNQPHVLQHPGSYWDYNDIRVNFLCLSLTRLFGRPLGEVLQDTVLSRLDAAAGWEWSGLFDSVTQIEGCDVACVVGGGHWGGGLVTAALHDARLGLLVARGGMWGDRRVLSRDWLATMLSPCALNPVYGALWWLNTGRLLHRAASPEAVFAFGVGMHAIWVDPTIDLVVVARWIAADAFDSFVTLLMASRDR